VNGVKIPPVCGRVKRPVVDPTALRNVVNTAAARMGVSQHEMAVAMTYFFEALIDEVVVGNPVEIYGVGAWFPVLCETKSNPGGAPPVARPVIFFSAVRQWRQAVARECPKAIAQQNLQVYYAYRKHRTLRTKTSGRQHPPPGVTLERWRKMMKKDIPQKTFRTNYHGSDRRVR
jgi:hypothetical protein